MKAGFDTMYREDPGSHLRDANCAFLEQLKQCCQRPESLSLAQEAADKL